MLEKILRKLVKLLGFQKAGSSELKKNILGSFFQGAQS